MKPVAGALGGVAQWAPSSVSPSDASEGPGGGSCIAACISSSARLTGLALTSEAPLSSVVFDMVGCWSAWGVGPARVSPSTSVVAWARVKESSQRFLLNLALDMVQAPDRGMLRVAKRPLRLKS